MFARWLIAVIVCAFLAPAQAQTWPSKPVRIVVPFRRGHDGHRRALHRVELQRMWQHPSSSKTGPVRAAISAPISSPRPRRMATPC